MTPTARLLLIAIHEKTQGRNRAVRDVVELETRLTAEEARIAWQDLLGQGLIERFSQEYAARLSVKGIDLIQSGRLEGQSPEAIPHPAIQRKVLILHGQGTGARDAVALFVEELACQAIMLQDRVEHGPTTMEQVEKHGDVELAIVLLTRDDLGFTAGGTAELRPRMDVLMDLGYLIGRFGRAKVLAFAIQCATDRPRDLAGVALEAFDSSAGWKSILTLALAIPA